MDFCPITDAYQYAPQLTGRIDIQNDQHQQEIQTQINTQIKQGIFKSFVLAYEDKKKNGKPTKPHYHFSLVPSYAFFQEKLNNKDPIKAIREAVIKPLQTQLKKHTKDIKSLISIKTNLTDAYHNMEKYILALAYTVKQENIPILHNEEFIQQALELSRHYTEEHKQHKKQSSKEALLQYLQEEQPEATTVQQLTQVCILYYHQHDLLLPPPTRFKSILLWVIYKQYPGFEQERQQAEKQMYYII